MPASPGSRVCRTRRAVSGQRRRARRGSPTRIRDQGATRSWRPPRGRDGERDRRRIARQDHQQDQPSDRRLGVDACHHGDVADRDTTCKPPRSPSVWRKDTSGHAVSTAGPARPPEVPVARRAEHWCAAWRSKRELQERHMDGRGDRGTAIATGSRSGLREVRRRAVRQGPNNPIAPITTDARRPPVRIRLQRINADRAKLFPPDGDGKIWWARLKRALGTSSSTFVSASLAQLQSAARLPFSGISDTALNAALAMIEQPPRKTRSRER